MRPGRFAPRMLCSQSDSPSLERLRYTRSPTTHRQGVVGNLHRNNRIAAPTGDEIENLKLTFFLWQRGLFESSHIGILSSGPATYFSSTILAFYQVLVRIDPGRSSSSRLERLRGLTGRWNASIVVSRVMKTSSSNISDVPRTELKNI